MEVCMVCRHKFGLLETTVQIRTPVKPKGSPNRYKVIGRVCDNDECYEKSNNNRESHE